MNPNGVQSKNSGSDSGVGASSHTMTVPPQSESGVSDTSHDSDPQREPDTNPELRLPTPQADDSISRVEARRATRKLVRRKLQSPAPPIPGEEKEKQPLNPAWIGFSVAVVVGLIGWGAYSFFFSAEESVVETVDVLVEAENAAKNKREQAAESDSGAVSTDTKPTATLVSLPTESPEQAAARQENEQREAEKASQTAELKKK